MVDLNLRSLKKGDDGYTVLTPTEQALHKNICNHCARQSTCSVPKKIGENSTYKFRLEVCKAFSPPLLFVSPKGMSGVFNTMRLGLTWVARVEVGTVCGYVDKDDNVFGYGRVVKVIGGDKEDMIRKHGHKNHLVIDNGMTRKEAVEKMFRLIPQTYGNLIYKNNAAMTVIYLESIPLD